MKPPLKSLDEHEREARERHESLERRRSGLFPSGIACPACGAELMEMRGAMLMSNPPRYGVQCPACGYQGYRTV